MLIKALMCLLIGLFGINSSVNAREKLSHTDLETKKAKGIKKVRFSDIAYTDFVYNGKSRTGEFEIQFERIVFTDNEDESIQTIAALAAGSFAATRELAAIMGEKEFKTVFHKGTETGIFIQCVASHYLLLAVMSEDTTEGLVKLYADKICTQIEPVLVAQPAYGSPVHGPAGQPSIPAVLALPDFDVLAAPASQETALGEGRPLKPRPLYHLVLAADRNGIVRPRRHKVAIPALTRVEVASGSVAGA